MTADLRAPIVFVPAAPMLLASLNPSPTPEQEAVRMACQQAVSALAGSRRVVLIGSAGCGLRPDGEVRAPGLHRVELPADRDATPDQAPATPTSALVGADLLRAAGIEAPIDPYVAAGVPDDLRAPAGGDGPGWRLTAGDGVLVVADGTGTRHEKAPGHIVPGAVDLDDRIANLLADGDLDGLLALDPDLDQKYLLDGRAAWQAAAALVRNSGTVAGSDLLGLFDPLHVAYFVAEWQVALTA